MSGAFKYVRLFDEIGGDDVPLVGGKNASLGEMYRGLRPKGILVPNGFAVTAEAYRYVLDKAGAWGPLRAALEGLDPGDVDDLARRGRRAREIVYQAALPEDLQAEILAAHQRLREEYGPELTVAVRSSATAEDLPERQLRRPARDVPQRSWRRGPPGRLPSLLRQPLHRSRHSLPHRPGVRSLQGLPVRRRHEDGPFRPGRERRRSSRSTRSPASATSSW